jgi:fatty acid desaturase
MASAALSATKEKSLNDPHLKERLQELRRTDNLVNWYYFLRTYLFFVVVIGGAVWFDLWRQQAGFSWLWDVPVFAVAIVLVGAGQHQLSALAHEASHHILFRNRLLNDLVSDLGCMFPLFSSTHHYRLQHLAHHQFVNDPLRDPDVSQLQTSGHWLHFPVSKRFFLATLLKQLWLPNLLRFIFIRARYNATGTDKNPYISKGVRQSKLPIRVGLLYLVAQIGLLTWLAWTEQTLLLAILPLVLLAAVLTFYVVLPRSKFHQSRLHSVMPQRVMTLLRVSYVTGVFYALAWITVLTGVWAAMYYALLWVVPLLTSFSFFMILRQLVQHGNGGRGWLTNTRMFFLQPFIRFSVFPLGQDFHLPHHLYATVPHYRLLELHRTLLEYPEYRQQAVEVHGYFVSPEKPQVHPTVLDVLGPAYAPRDPRDVYIDNTVLDDCKVEEKEAIVQEGEAEVRRLAEAPTNAAG